MGAFIGFIIFVAIIYYIFKLFEHNEREKTDDRNNFDFEQRKYN